MKTILTVLFTSILVLASFAQAQNYQTLDGYLETLTIPAGQTALVVSASSGLVVEVKGSDDRYGKQFRFREESGSRNCQSSYRRYRQNVLPTPSFQNPVPIAGPAQLTLRTSGLLTVRLPEQRRRPSGLTSQGAARRFAVR